MSNGDPRKLTLREDVSAILGPGAAPLEAREAYSATLPSSSYSGPQTVGEWFGLAGAAVGAQVLAFATANPLIGLAATGIASGITRQFAQAGPIAQAQNEQLDIEQPRGGFTPWPTGGTYPGFSIREIYPGGESWRVESGSPGISWEDKLEAAVTRSLYR